MLFVVVVQIYAVDVEHHVQLRDESYNQLYGAASCLQSELQRGIKR